jgi:uncharacterized protein
MSENMELTQEFIDNLAVNEAAVMKRVAEALSVNVSQVQAVIALLKEDCTVPFIARYRKEAHGNLDEVQIRGCEHGWISGSNLEERRIEISRAIFEQGKLTEALYENIAKAAALAELEDLYAPYKKKKKTRGMIAVERGLQALADAMRELDEDGIVALAAGFVVVNTENEGLSVPTVTDALQGAMDIVAEAVSQDMDNRAVVKKFYLADAKVIVKGAGTEEEKKTSVYQMYWDYNEPLSQIKAHRILAINRGEREHKLDVTIDADVDGAVRLLQNRIRFYNTYHKTAIEDGLKRLLSPAVIRELRGNLSDDADEHGISIFSANLKNLLMQQPIKGTRVLGVDPGIRTGTKCAALDETGKYLGDFKIYNHEQATAKKLIYAAIKQYAVQLIAIGNGTGSKDVQAIVAEVIAESAPDVLYTVVDEDGASVYSASDIAREEFPELDLTIRGAISIGRRLQDPLAELVKIDPRSIGVGLYQHDVNQKKLSETLDEVVSSVVNHVGVNLNTASASLLKYVSGINNSLAKKIVRYRDEKGKIKSREELTGVPGMGPKSFEQCAGFLKIPDSSEALDNTWVHPENYEAARVIQKNITTTGGLAPAKVSEIREKYNIGEATIGDIVEELKKPGRDPREGFPKPIMQKDVITFEDLQEGQTVTGKVKNVVDFGAFVDLGIKETALVHISELSDTYVKNPLDLVKAGDVLEFRIIGLDVDRRRISLSRKSGGAASAHAAKAGGGAKVSVKKDFPQTGSGKRAGGDRRASSKDDDGTMYNPFALAFKGKR